MTDGMGCGENQDKRVKQLKRSLEGWREVLLPLSSVLAWEQKWHPGAIVGTISFGFLLVWWMDPAVLTFVSLVALLAVLVDYLVPALASGLCKADSWTGTKERKLEEVCRSLATFEGFFKCLWGSMQSWRNVRPKLYYITVITFLLVSAYIGSIIDNLLLTYLFVVIMALQPGVSKHGLLKKYAPQLVNSVTGLMNLAGKDSDATAASDAKPKKNN